MNTFASHVNVELQQRGVEFSQLFRGQDSMRIALLERMPPMPRSQQFNSSLTNGDVLPSDGTPTTAGDALTEQKTTDTPNHIQVNNNNTESVSSKPIILVLF